MYSPDRSKNFMFFCLAFCGICVAILAMIAALSQIKSMKQSTNKITIKGTASVNMVPNVGVINLSVIEVAAITSDAQNAVKEKVQNILKSLNEMGINQEDIKTESYNLVQKYDYPQAPACLQSPCPPTPKPVLIGYEATQSIDVKIREINKIDNVFELFGKLGITQFFGPNFIVEDSGKSKEEARVKAITDAKTNAVKLAKDLGIKLGKIISFDEQNLYQPNLPLAKGGMMGLASTSGNSSNMNSITPGENKITSNVFITYEIQ